METDSPSTKVPLKTRFASRLSPNLVLLPILLVVLSVVPTAVSQTTAYSLSDVEKLAKQGTEEHDFLESVKQHGVSFAPTLEVIEDLKASHVPDSVLKEIWAHIPQSQPPDFYLREGDRLLANGYYAEAAAYYQRMLVLLPDDPVAKARMAQATERQQKAEAEAKHRATKDNERPNLPYYREQLRTFLQKPDCKGAFYYAYKVFFIDPAQSDKAAYEKVCGPYSLTLEDGTSVTLALQHALSGSGAHSGDKVGFTVVEAIVVNGLLVVPKDGIAWGTVAKSEGGRHLSRSGEVQINIEGMWLADGEKCPLASEETYRGSKRSKKGNTAVVAGDVFTGGLLALHHGRDATVPAGTKITAHVAGKISLDPAQFEPSGTPSPIVPPSSVVSGLSVISFQNQSGTDAMVRLLGPSAQVVAVADGQSLGAPVVAGDYFVVVRYGRSDSGYLFQKAGPIPVTEPSGKHSVVHITLQRPAANDPKARAEFYKGQ
jgi:hypothetical protein